LVLCGNMCSWEEACQKLLRLENNYMQERLQQQQPQQQTSLACHKVKHHKQCPNKQQYSIMHVKI